MYVAYASPVPANHRDPSPDMGRDGAANRSLVHASDWMLCAERCLASACRLLVDAWLRHVERRTEAVVRQLGHAGLLEDFEASRRC
jgi:hypothetical protein